MTHSRRCRSLDHLGLIILVSACGSSPSSDVGPGAGSGGGADAGSGGAPLALAGGGSGGNSGVSGTSAAAGGATAGISGSSIGGGGGQLATGECTPPTNVDAPLEKLSQTGCMDPTDKTKFASRVIPYEVNSPLWSDSADKQRGMVIPVAQKVHIKDCAAETCTQNLDTGKWVFPVGTVMLKNFLFDEKLVETRLFVHHDADTWVGYSYQWDEAQTEATIVPDGRRAVMFNTGSRSVPWNYPSRTDCMKCHNAAGGSTLGPQTRQMNRMIGGKNQIETLSAMNVFDKAPSAPYQEALVVPYPSQAGSPPAGATIEQKARSYLEANCAFCHRPDDSDLGMVNIDLRITTALRDMKLCNAPPVKGDNGVPTATLLTPNDPSQSLTWLRMNSPPMAGRMPQIGTAIIDTDGVKLIGDWIGTIKDTDCQTVTP
jgi:uncharacterized repeat protein (TIGR03806 family)